MPLIHLLYRCPLCGQDPVTGDLDLVTCPACGARFERSREGAEVVVSGTDAGATETLHPRELCRQIRSLGGPLTVARKPDGSLRYEAAAHMARAAGEEPIRRGRHLLGFAEHFGEEIGGTLVVTEGVLVFEGSGRHGEAWDLTELAAVQVSSNSLQVRPQGGAVVRFRFVSDSPRRWEALLHHVIRDVYRKLELGEVEAFQPRIVAG